MVIHLIQEIKRDIVYWRVNASTHRNRVKLTRLHAHVITNVQKLYLLQHQGTKNHQESILFFMLLEGTINERV